MNTQQGGEWGVLKKELCRQIYLNELKEGDEISISFWEIIYSIVNASYNEGYEDGQQKRENTKT